MHVDNELIEFVPADEQDYEKIIEEYKEEVLVQKGASKPFVADFVDTPPAQGKPRCITPIFNDHWIYMMCIYITGILWKLHAEIYLPMSPTSIGWVAAMLRVLVAWVTYRYSQ